MVALWSTSRRAINLAAAALLVVCCGVVYVVEQNVVTERERVEAAVFGVADAFRAADTGRTLDFISPRAMQLKVIVEHVMVDMQVRVKDDLRITDVNIEMLNEETRARSHLRANGRIFVPRYGGDVGHQPTRWNLTWQKEGGEWKIINVERLDPIRGDPVDLLTGEAG
jgi:hypothetical protein